MKMEFRSCTFLLLPIWIAVVLSDFVGPTYPAPMDLSSNQSIVIQSWKNLSSTISAYLNGSQSSEAITAAGLTNLTFSMNMFSMHDLRAAESLQYHYTSEEVAKASTGVNEVDGDSIYRIASITKLITVYVGMLNLKESDWDRPLTDFLPGLADYQREHISEDGPVWTVQWDQITLAALAAQIAGVPRDVLPFYVDIMLDNETIQELGGLPPLDYTDPTVLPPCSAQGLFSDCTGDLYSQGEQSRPPVYLPWSTPMYTDNGYMLLGLAIANITGRSMHELYIDSIFEPLGLTYTNSSVPPKAEFTRSVIPGGDAIAAVFDVDGGISTPAGGLFSTVNDLAKVGVSILNSTLLPSNVTRKWMKPVSHTARLQYAVGRPWEIYRYRHQSGHITDIYTKLGDSGNYGGYLALIPEYDAGFSILGASLQATRSAATQLVADVLTETMLPALESEARREAGKNIAGTYVSTTKGLNSSLTLALNQTVAGATGMIVTEWISNGTNFLANMKKVYGSAYDPLRLLPSIPDSGSGKMAFQHSNTLDPADEKAGVAGVGLFTGNLALNTDWIVTDNRFYGGDSLTLFVFDVAADGKATAVTPAALRVKLARRD